MFSMSDSADERGETDESIYNAELSPHSFRMLTTSTIMIQ